MKEQFNFGFLPRIIEIPADILLYWTLQSVNFKGVVYEQDLNRYHEAICKAHGKFKSSIEEALAFNFPYANNYTREVFEELTDANGKTAFRLRKVEGGVSRELLEYRLAKFESFGRMQKPIVREMFLLAAEFYQMSKPQVTYIVKPKKSVKQKMLTLATNIKEKIMKK